MKRNHITAAVGALVLMLCGLAAWQARHASVQNRGVEHRESEIPGLDTFGEKKQAGMDDFQRLAALRTLRQALENERTLPLTIERERALEGGIRYLDGMRPYAAQNPAVGAE